MKIYFNNIQTAKPYINKQQIKRKADFQTSNFNLDYNEALALKNIALYSPNFTSKRVYALSSNGEIKHFKNKAIARNSLDLSVREFEEAIKKSRITSNGMVLFTQDEVEIKQEDGKYTLDYEKIKKVQKDLRLKSASKEICVFDEDFEPLMIFRDIKTASSELDITQRRIKNCVEGKNGVSIDGYYFFKADDVSVINDEGKREYNTQKARELALLNSRTTTGKPVYSISPTGQLQYYISALQASRITGANDTSIILARTGTRNIDTCNGYFFFDAKEVDSLEGEEREKKINEFKIEAMKIFDRKKPTIYAFSREGIKTYTSYDKIAEDFVTSVYTVKAKIKNGEMLENNMLVFARDVAEIQPDGSFKPIEEKFNSIKEKVLKNSIEESVYAFDKQGNYKRFDNLFQLCSILNPNDPQTVATNVRTTFRRDKGTIFGYVIIKAKEIEKLEKDLTITLDLENALKKVQKRYSPKNIKCAKIKDLN